MQVSSDAELVRSALAGDRTGFDELIRRYQRQATVTAYRLLSNRDDAMEVTQDGFLRAFERLETLEDPERFAPWLLRIISNLSLNRRRSRAIRKTASLDVAEGEREESLASTRSDPKAVTPLERASASDMMDVIQEAIDELPELQREALVLFSIQKMPQKEVAVILGCSVEMVKWNVFEARRRLRKRLGKLGLLKDE